MKVAKLRITGTHGTLYEFEGLEVEPLDFLNLIGTVKEIGKVFGRLKPARRGK